MKKLFFPSIIASILALTACNSNSDKSKETTTIETTPIETTTIDTSTPPVITTPVAEQLYACSMHPEVIGKKDEKCPKCGMKLTEPVKK
jgi:hypothetical protein